LKPDERRRLLTELLETHGRRLYVVLVRLTLCREVADELVQELFLRLSRSPGFETARDRPAYAFRAAINLAMEWRRCQRRSAPAEGDSSLIRAASDAPSPLQRMVDNEQVEQLLDAIGELSDLSRESFVLRFIEQEPYQVIARKMGKTPQQIRGLCHAAVRKLREMLAERSTPSEPR
jgi:RNA polymerase sigma factor (sigma-70 family)